MKELDDILAKYGLKYVFTGDEKGLERLIHGATIKFVSNEENKKMKTKDEFIKKLLLTIINDEKIIEVSDKSKFLKKMNMGKYDRFVPQDYFSCITFYATYSVENVSLVLGGKNYSFVKEKIDKYLKKDDEFVSYLCEEYRVKKIFQPEEAEVELLDCFSNLEEKLSEEFFLSPYRQSLEEEVFMYLSQKIENSIDKKTVY